MKQLLIFLIALSSLSCSKKTVEPIAPPKETTEDDFVVWRKLIYEGNENHQIRDRGGFFFHFDGRKDMLAVLAPSSNDYKLSLGLFNPEGKKFLWQWTDPSETGIAGWYAYGNQMYVNAKHDQYVLDLLTGEATHFNLEGRVITGLSGYQDKIFQVRYEGGDVQVTHTSTIYMGGFGEDNWEPLFTTDIADKDGFGSDLRHPVVRLLDGDTILFFQDLGYRRTVWPKNRTDFYAYNLSTRKLMWQKMDFTEEFSNSRPPAVDEVNKRVYYLSRYTIYCWDMETGAEIWQKTLDYAGILSSDYIVSDGKLITVTDQGYLIAFDGATGERLYYEKKGGCCVSGLQVHNGLIYYDDLDLFVSDINTGKTVWRYHGYNGFNGAPTFDDEAGVMYLTGPYYMYCLKIPE